MTERKKVSKGGDGQRQRERMMGDVYKEMREGERVWVRTSTWLLRQDGNSTKGT